MFSVPGLIPAHSPQSGFEPDASWAALVIFQRVSIHAAAETEKAEALLAQLDLLGIVLV